jgi:hypothetical protein
MVCKDLTCRTVLKGLHYTCPKCNWEMVSISTRARVPKQGDTASINKEWVIFWHLFAYWVPRAEREAWKLSPNGKAMGTFL